MQKKASVFVKRKCIFFILDGQMKLMSNELLPLGYHKGTIDCGTRSDCSLVGDERGDENIALLSMHTIWVREHNRISRELKKLNPQWDHNHLYQTSRKIVGALLQHVTYNEFVSLLLSKLPPYEGKHNPDKNPSIINGFATAAFRFGHSLIPNEFVQLDAGFNVKQKPVTLQKAFFNRDWILKNGIESTIFGLVKNSSKEVDDKFSFTVARRLFVGFGQTGHLDLTALNIQRGRDHGLPPYNEYRKICNMRPIDNWENLKEIMMPGAAERLQKIYASIQDIDFFAGGMSEKHLNGLMVGPTFNCMLVRQFEALRDGDRFYYEAEGVFTRRQLHAIKKTSLSTVLCNNLRGIVSIQPRALLGDGPNNKRVSCKGSSRIEELDLTPWKV